MLILSNLGTAAQLVAGVRTIRGYARNTIRGSNPMTTDLRPAEPWLPLDVDERDYVRVTYEDQLDAGETITTVQSVTCEAIEGTDATAPSRLSGSPQISSPEVSHLMAGVVDGVNYLVRFVVNTSAGRRLTIAGTVLGTRVGGAAP